MRLDITGRHFTVTAATRKFAEQRLAHAVRLLNNSAVSAHVALTKERGRVEMGIPTWSLPTVVASGDDFVIMH